MGDSKSSNAQPTQDSGSRVPLLVGIAVSIGTLVLIAALLIFIACLRKNHERKKNCNVRNTASPESPGGHKRYVKRWNGWKSVDIDLESGRDNPLVLSQSLTSEVSASPSFREKLPRFIARKTVFAPQQRPTTITERPSAETVARTTRAASLSASPNPLRQNPLRKASPLRREAQHTQSTPPQMRSFHYPNVRERVQSLPVPCPVRGNGSPPQVNSRSVSAFCDLHPVNDEATTPRTPGGMNGTEALTPLVNTSTRRRLSPHTPRQSFRNSAIGVALSPDLRASWLTRHSSSGNAHLGSCEVRDSLDEARRRRSNAAPPEESPGSDKRCQRPDRSSHTSGHGRAGSNGTESSATESAGSAGSAAQYNIAKIARRIHYSASHILRTWTPAGDRNEREGVGFAAEPRSENRPPPPPMTPPPRLSTPKFASPMSFPSTPSSMSVPSPASYISVFPAPPPAAWFNQPLKASTNPVLYESGKPRFDSPGRRTRIMDLGGERRQGLVLFGNGTQPYPGEASLLEEGSIRGRERDWNDM